MTFIKPVIKTNIKIYAMIENKYLYQKTVDKGNDKV